MSKPHHTRQVSPDATPILYLVLRAPGLAVRPRYAWQPVNKEPPQVDRSVTQLTLDGYP